MMHFSQFKMVVWKVPGTAWSSLVKNVRTPLEVMAVPVRSFADHQKALPMLPVPPLQQTLDKYLCSVKPLVTEDEFRVTQDIVKKFGEPNGEGTTLQNLLEERAKAKENWLTDWWIRTAYFEFRSPVVVWSSPGLVFPIEHFKNLDDQIHYAALTVSGALDYKILIDEKKVPVEMMGKNALDMSQYFQVFGTCRIPGVTCDSLEFYGHGGPETSRHVVIAHNNHFFRVDVYGADNKPLNYLQIAQQLRNVVERSTHATFPVGILTSQNRNVWGKTYKHLKKDRLNKESLQDIRSALFLVCLDGPITKSTDSRMTDAALLCLHGNDVDGNSGNRWFDKCLQFIIGKKGETGMTYEHSPSEGPVVANLMDHIMDFRGRKDNNDEQPPPAVGLSRPKRLMFKLSSEVMSEIESAKQALQSLIDDVDMNCFSFANYGKSFIKSHKMSPDSYIQMAIQFAFYRIYKEPAAHYESASTRMYAKGRTETIRSCSVESVTFAESMLDPNASNERKINTLKAAVEAHKKYVIDAVRGHGVDRHLLGLKLTAIESGMNVPGLFMDVSYVRSSHMRLSTSQVGARCEAFMCYGPLVPDGYGCCYNPRKDSIVFGTSALNSSPETQTSIFRTALEDSLMEMHDLLLSEGGLKAKL